MTLYHLDDHPPLTDPLMIVAFDAWVDAGAAATTAARLIAEPAEPIAGIEADRLYDYRARRPTLYIDDGHLVSADWPRLTVRHRRFERRDVLVLAGPEPDYRWRELSRELVMLARDLEVVEWLTLGAIPAAVPHTRPVNLLGTASEKGRLQGGVQAGPTGSMQVPAAAVSIIDIAIAEAGIPTVGYFAQVPHYVNGEYPAAAVALIRAVEHHIGEPIPTAGLELAATTMSAKLDTAAAADDSTTTYVARLEEMSDETRLPSGDELIGEIERFLREQDRGDGDLPR
ncbi:MAG: PAC2 family protein [Candidatus Limnocylindrales bacterium]